MDDWSYVRTAQLLAETGHVHYNGWATAMLGWPLYVAALFIKLFGFSFTVVRLTTVLIAAVTVLLLQRTLLRAGLNQWNATLGTLTFVVSPIFLVASSAFLSDIPGALAVVVCLYACLRALQAESPRAKAAWISFAALSNAVLGTSRQLAWLGLLVMVPCTVWLLRRTRVAVIAGLLSASIGAIFVVIALHWLDRQPYSVPEHLARGHLDTAAFGRLIAVLVRLSLDMVLFMLPVALAFLPVLKRASRRALIITAALLGLLTLPLLALHAHHMMHTWTAPFLLFTYVHPQSMENTFTSTTMPIKGLPPFPLSDGLRFGISAVVLIGVCALLVCLFDRSSWRTQRETTAADLPLRDLLVITVPFLLVYCALLLPRGVFLVIFDRYYMLILPLVLLLLLRFYQRRVGARLPVACTGLLLIMAAYSILTLHDFFATYRAALDVCNQLRSAGVPRVNIDGGWEYNHYTQLLAGGFVYQPGARMPDGRILPELDSVQTVCSMEAHEQTPDVHPLYAIAYPTSPCAPVKGFAPVHFTTWLPPHRREAIVVHYVAQGPVPGAH